MPGNTGSRDTRGRFKLNSEYNELGAETPDVVGPESVLGTGAAYDLDVDAAFGGDDALTPGPVEDLAADDIADAVGPGALAEPLGPEATHELAEAASEASPAQPDRELIDSDPTAAALIGDINTLDADTARLEADDQALDPDAGEYWADLRTGRVESEPDDGVYSRIGPFKTAGAARAAITDALDDAGGYREYSA